ncbi:MAG: hypothetical protein J5666_06140, partial [Bacilli bacterium]|nr:hypothetical protein [Bacilli bacterium]
MNKIIYNQHYFKSGENIVYQGEDTYPYSTKNILLVADGLGGRGGFPHKKILEHDDDILDKDKFYDKVFGKVFEVEADENLKEYILQAFNEIFETKDYYKLSNKTYRSSGYFASRLVSSIALYEIYNNSFLNVKKLFEDIEKEKEKYKVDDKQKEDQCSFKAIKKYANTLSESIKEKLEEIADRVGFEIETSAGGAYLLPTTLAIALVNDSDDREDIDVVYLWAGDSRGYMWNKDGLAVLTDDHEKNETMTNLITLSQDFYIEGKMYNFKKPCILFNASDGC